MIVIVSHSSLSLILEFIFIIVLSSFYKLRLKFQYRIVVNLVVRNLLALA